ncbi:hypothetical protein [Aquabacterium sp.]|uniref:hypothetical protein n=1 Tax=Aquabacterium sp. TaxID=1872578 RepID=UPI0035B3CEF6
MANGSAIQVIVKGSAWSTPQSDTTPTPLVGNEFETALRLMQAEAVAFAESVIKDPAARAEYAMKTKAACDELIERVKQRQITPHEAAKTANAMRNQIMELARAKLSNFGLAVSESVKKSGKQLQELEDVYALRRYQRAFSTLAQVDKEQVWMDIVHAAGKPQAAMNGFARWYGVAGRTLLIASLAYAVYSVTTAKDKTRQTAKEGTTLAAGVAGGAAAGVGVALVASTPPGWVVGVAMFVTAALAGVGSAELFDYFWPER